MLPEYQVSKDHLLGYCHPGVTSVLWSLSPVSHQDHPLEPILFFSASVFSIPGKMVFNLSWQILLFSLIIFMGGVEINFPLLGCICGDLLVRKLWFKSSHFLLLTNYLKESKSINFSDNLAFISYSKNDR